MRRLDEYVSAGGRLLRCGYTTGTCAAAATRAAVDLLLGHQRVPAVSVQTPAGICVRVDVEEAVRNEDWARCAVRKDAGDDPDVTDGMLVCAKVSLSGDGAIHIDGGEGVGRITKPGLDQPVGAAAINTVPRQMIRAAARDGALEHGYAGGLTVVVSVPGGEAIARRTFNPRLGIEGGVSVLGTTGIVRPMSEDALISTIKLELGMLREHGDRHVLMVPGNFGLAFVRERLGLSTGQVVSCSNYVGEAIDEAVRLDFDSLLLVGHAGKLVKLAAGIMNTHSRVADGRAEVLATHAALVGASRDQIRDIVDAATTDAIFDVLQSSGLAHEAMASVMGRIADVLRHRTDGDMRVEAIMFVGQEGLVGMTPGARRLIKDAWHVDVGRMKGESAQGRTSVAVEGDLA